MKTSLILYESKCQPYQHAMNTVWVSSET